MKETIKVADLATNAEYPDETGLSIDEWDTYEVIEEKQTSYDREKGFVNYDIIVQRLSDSKFFKFSYTQFGHNGDNILEQTAYEVQEKTKTVKYYE